MISTEEFRKNLTAEQVEKIFEAKMLELRRSPSEIILSDKQLCKLLGVSPRLTSIWRAEMKIGYSKVGQKIFYTLEDVLQMLQNFKVENIQSSLKIKI